MLTKQHFIVLAGILRETKTEHNPKCYFTEKALEDLTNRLNEYLASQNPNFNRTKFLEASRP